MEGKVAGRTEGSLAGKKEKRPIVSDLYELNSL